MAEFFIVANSFAAPFCSDRTEHYVEAQSAEVALALLAKSYSHPAGLYAAEAYASHKDSIREPKPLARWLCNLQIAMDEVTSGLSSYSIRSAGNGWFEVNGKKHHATNYRHGRVVEVRHG